MTQEEQRKLEALVNRQDLTLNNKGILPNNISTNIFDGTLDLLGVPKSTRDSIRIDVNPTNKQASISVATSEYANVTASISAGDKTKSTYNLKLNIKL